MNKSPMSYEHLRKLCKKLQMIDDEVKIRAQEAQTASERLALASREYQQTADEIREYNEPFVMNIGSYVVVMDRIPLTPAHPGNHSVAVKPLLQDPTVRGLRP